MVPTLPTFERTLGAHQYTVTRLGFWKWRDLAARLESLLGPALLSAISQGEIKGLLDLDLHSIGEAILRLLGAATGSESTSIFRELGENTKVSAEGQTRLLTNEIQDFWWAQNPEELVPWLLFCLEVQFRDFFYTHVSKILKNLEK